MILYFLESKYNKGPQKRRNVFSGNDLENKQRKERNVYSGSQTRRHGNEYERTQVLERQWLR